MSLLGHYNPQNTGRRRKSPRSSHSRTLLVTTPIAGDAEATQTHDEALWREPSWKHKTNPRHISPPPHPLDMGETQTGNRTGLRRPAGGYPNLMKTPPPNCTSYWLTAGPRTSDLKTTEEVLVWEPPCVGHVAAKGLSSPDLHKPPLQIEKLGNADGV